MRLFDLIKVWEPDCTPENAKVHLARWNGMDDPLEVFVNGEFEDWQCWQSQHHFNRRYVVSLIQTSGTRWLFAGLFRPTGHQWIEATAEVPGHFWYDLERLASGEEWIGRLYADSPYNKRNSRPTGERLADELTVAELLPERLAIGPFQGYNKVLLTKGKLDLIVKHNVESWRSALSSVKGIYLVSDSTNGKLYVGKAAGVDGIWGRWCTYAHTGHGNNIALMEEFGIAAPPERKNDLRFSILEIADINATDLDQRENHWKDVLDSRSFGYNRN